MSNIENAQQMLDIILPIPAENFVSGMYIDDNGNSCFLGHIHRHFDEEDAYGDGQGYGARQLTSRFLKEIHGLFANGASVNNEPNVNGYTEPVIKDRIVHMLQDMIKAGY